MATNITRKEQNDKWFALSKQAFVNELLHAKPKDFQERNHSYYRACNLLSYPLQLISILAGSYLLFEIIQYVWQLRLYTSRGAVAFAACIGIFIGIESLRRWLVNTTGYNYLTTFKIVDQQLKKGEWLQSNLICLFLISCILIATGTMGVYQYIKQSSPKASTYDVAQVVSPIEQKIKDEKTTIQRLDQDIQGLMQAKKRELKDPKSYAIWKGKEYLLPEVKKRHTNYDKQIDAMHLQRQTHQVLIQQYEKKLNRKESQTTKKNQEIIQTNKQHKEVYAGTTAGIWLCFEMMLVYMLSYQWLYLYGAKKESLLENAEASGKEFYFSDLNTKPSSYAPSKENSRNSFQASYEEKETFQAWTGSMERQEIGFEKWYNNDFKKVKKKESKTIVREVPKKVLVEKAKIAYEGFAVTCVQCGQHTIKKRPAKYCSASCRTKAWKERSQHMIGSHAPQIF